MPSFRFFLLVLSALVTSSGVIAFELPDEAIRPPILGSGYSEDLTGRYFIAVPVMASVGGSVDECELMANQVERAVLSRMLEAGYRLVTYRELKLDPSIDAITYYSDESIDTSGVEVRTDSVIYSKRVGNDVLFERAKELGVPDPILVEVKVTMTREKSHGTRRLYAWNNVSRVNKLYRVTDKEALHPFTNLTVTFYDEASGPLLIGQCGIDSTYVERRGWLRPKLAEEYEADHIDYAAEIALFPLVESEAASDLFGEGRLHLELNEGPVD